MACVCYTKIVKNMLNSPAAYYATLSIEQLAELQRVKGVVLEVEPKAEEVLSYGIPTLDYNGKHLIHYAAFKDHYSIFPGPPAVESLQKELSKFETSKGTIKYTKENYLPDGLITELVRLRLAEIGQQV